MHRSLHFIQQCCPSSLLNYQVGSHRGSVESVGYHGRHLNICPASKQSLSEHHFLSREGRKSQKRAKERKQTKAVISSQSQENGTEIFFSPEDLALRLDLGNCGCSEFWLEVWVLLFQKTESHEGRFNYSEFWLEMLISFKRLKSPGGRFNKAISTFQ